MGPNIKMMANRPVAVAAAFSNSSSPTAPGESCWAAIPEPMTTAARKALPRNSAKRRLHKGDTFIWCRSPLARVLAAGRGTAVLVDLVGATCGRAVALGAEAALEDIGVAEHRIELPGGPPRPYGPDFVLQCVATLDVIFDLGGDAGPFEPGFGGRDLAGAPHLHAEMVERARISVEPSIRTSFSGGSTTAKLAYPGRIFAGPVPNNLV